MNRKDLEARIAALNENIDKALGRKRIPGDGDGDGIPYEGKNGKKGLPSAPKIKLELDGSGNPMYVTRGGKGFTHTGKTGESFGKPGGAPKGTKMFEMKHTGTDQKPVDQRLWVSRDGKYVVDD